MWKKVAPPRSMSLSRRGPFGRMARMDTASSPCLPWAWFEDDRRNQLGYWVQYILLYVLTWLKQDARNAVFGDGYVHTVDGTRYVVLVVERSYWPCVCGR